jgi:hypothetical protein
VGVAANGMRDVDESAVAEAALQLAVQLSFHVGHGRPDTAMASTAIADGYPGGPGARRPLAPIPRLLTTGPGDPCLIGPRWYGHPEPGGGGVSNLDRITGMFKKTSGDTSAGADRPTQAAPEPARQEASEAAAPPAAEPAGRERQGSSGTGGPTS